MHGRAYRTERDGQERDVGLLRISDVMALTRLGRSTVFELLRQGELRSLKIGAARRVPRSELERWIRERMADGR